MHYCSVLLTIIALFLVGCVSDTRITLFDEAKLADHSIEAVYELWHAANRDQGTAFDRQMNARSGIFIDPVAMEQLERDIRSRTDITPEEHDAALKRNIFIGMSEKALLLSRGKPARQNRTVRPDGVFIQHVYPSYGLYVYTLDGVVTSWQD